MDHAALPQDVLDEEPFDAPVRGTADAVVDALIVNIEGFEGPLDILLELARAQKVDLRRISVLALVEQYLAFVDAARLRDLDLAADYLVMAAWLAYLKSKLLLPSIDTDGDEPTADEMAARLAFQLQRLEAMRKAADGLLARPQLGVTVFPRGAPEGFVVRRTTAWQATLFDLLQAYARQRVGAIDRTYVVAAPKVFTIEDARARIERMLGAIPEWTTLESLLPSDDVDAPAASVIASAFSATLEFAKGGRLDLRQLAAFEPIYVRRRQSPGRAEE
ncbi:MAG: segregation/condensation protein A [Parvularculaceae bacterium]|nr:segregation/condensation protein A [Parvularculaceae bacterium]